MKTKISTLVLLTVLAFAACKKAETVAPTTTTTTTTTTQSTDNPTEGSITIADNPNNSAKYDDKTITVKSFDIDKTLAYVSTSNITLQSKDKEGIFYKYNMGLNMNLLTPEIGKKYDAVAGTTPTTGINIYQGTDLCFYSCMNGTYTVEARDAHNITILFSGMDFKQSLSTGFDASLKRFSTKAFRLKVTY